jgi:hypothetical protein
MGLFDRLHLTALRDSRNRGASVRSRLQNRCAAQNAPQTPKRELRPFLTILGTRMRAGLVAASKVLFAVLPEIALAIDTSEWMMFFAPMILVMYW